MTETKLTHITFRPSRGGASGLAVLVLPRRQRVGLPRLHPEPLHQPRASGLHARAHAGGRAAGLPRLPSAPLRARPLPARRGRTGHTHDDELRFELSAVDFFIFFIFLLKYIFATFQGVQCVCQSGWAGPHCDQPITEGLDGGGGAVNATGATETRGWSNVLILSLVFVKMGAV